MSITFSTIQLLTRRLKRILEEHKPAHKVALISLCAATRPYSKAEKWKKYVATFGDKADLVVVSAGGVIPSRFWECYPFMTYDIKEDIKSADGLYEKKMYDRVTRFFTRFQYDHVVASFLPRSPNRPVAQQVLTDLQNAGSIGSFVITPNKAEMDEDKRWRQSAGLDKPGYWTRFPEINPYALEAISCAINSRCQESV